jgi:hypothetical protein
MSTAPESIGESGDSQGVIFLSPEEDLFITYLFEENMNRTRAYMRVYPNSKVESARSSASRMLTRDNVKAELMRRMKEEAMSEEEGIMRLTKVSRGTVTPFLKSGPDGFMYFDMSHPDAKENMFLVKEMETKRERRLVGSGEAAEEWEGEWVKVKLHDAYTATVDLLKIYGRFTKKIDVTTGGNPLPAVDAEGFDRSLSSLADAVKSLILKNEIPVTPRPADTPTESHE